ncbi:MAG: DNA internalization-related competence protein ComEC/Rec2 [Candidatus Omnitrophica bacterium]|nr:DNA internalization-related competence protein ComEC/Rec2 [Candidatus Omnitrophota bacterium]
MKRPILYILIPFCLGIAAARTFHFSFLYSIIPSAIFVIGSIVLSKNRKISLVSFFLAVFFAGAAVYINSNILAADNISNFIPSDERAKVLVRGTIADDPVISMTPYRAIKTSFTLKASMLKSGGSWRKTSGLVKTDIFSRGTQPLFFGNEVILQGVISKPHGLKNPGLFDYAEYLAIKNIYCRLRVGEGNTVEIFKKDAAGPVETAAYKIRHKMLALIDEYMAMPYSGFLKAILVGDKTGLKDVIQDDFIKTGTVHVIAVSGLQVGLIALVFLAIFRIFGLPRKVNLIVTASLLAVYAFIGGANPPVARAVIMFAIYVIGYLIDRDSDILNSLSLAALAILLWNPKELFDPSFQLSFVSVASTIIFAPKIYAVFPEAKFKKNPWDLPARAYKYITVGISVSVAAWIGSFPIIASYFNILSPVSIVANLIAVPALFLLVAVSFVFFAACFVWAGAAAFIAQGLELFERSIFAANSFMANMPMAFFRVGKLSPAAVIFYYFLVSFIIVPPKKRTVIAALVVLNIFVWASLIRDSAGSLKVTFLDVGQGDSAFVEFPGGNNMLIDAGPGGEEDRADMGESVVAPLLWNKGIGTISAVVVSHFHDDHTGGIPYVLKNFKIGCVIDSGASGAENENIYNEYLRLVKGKNIRRLTVREGDIIKFPGGAEMFVLNPEKDKKISDSNDNSLVLKLSGKNFRALFCGDIKDRAVSRIITYENFLRSDVIKIPHHGGDLGSAKVITQFIDAVSPSVSVISVGNLNKYGMPSKETLNIINTSNSKTYMTKEDGAIEISAVDRPPFMKVNIANKN